MDKAGQLIGWLWVWNYLDPFAFAGLFMVIVFLVLLAAWVVDQMLHRWDF